MQGVCLFMAAVCQRSPMGVTSICRAVSPQTLPLGLCPHVPWSLKSLSIVSKGKSPAALVVLEVLLDHGGSSAWFFPPEAADSLACPTPCTMTSGLRFHTRRTSKVYGLQKRPGKEGIYNQVSGQFRSSISRCEVRCHA